MAEEFKEKPLEKDERDTLDFWNRWIKSAETAAKDHWEMARDAWDEVENAPVRSGSDLLPSSRPDPIYWSSSKTLEPAYYTQTPKIKAKTKFPLDDPTALTAAHLEERMARYMTECVDFDSIMQGVVGDYMHADKATAQVTYSHDEEKIKERIPLQPLFDEGGYLTSLLTADGAEYGGEALEDGGGYYFEQETTVLTNQKVTLLPCQYDEVLHTPDAKHEGEVREKAYYFCLNKDEAIKRFGDDVAEDIKWKSKKDGKDRSRDDLEYQRDKTDAVGEYVEGWECWSKPNKKVYWVSKQYAEGFLDEKEDPYKLKDFFPSPSFIIGTKPAKSLFPTPVYAQLKPMIEGLHDAAARIHKLSRGIRRRALVQGGSPELLVALNSLDEGEFIECPNLSSLVEKGELDKAVWYVPIKELVDAIGEYSGLQDKFKNEFYEKFGLPEILRGQGNPYETADAQRMQAGAAHDRFKFQKKQIATMAHSLLRYMNELGFKLFEPEFLAEVLGFDYLPPHHKERYEAAVELIRSGKAPIRLEIDTDSMSHIDEQLRSQRMNVAVSTLTRGLEQVSQMLQTSPEYANVGLQAILLSLESLNVGGEFEDYARQAVQSLIEKSKAPPPPPPPDYEKMKLDLKQQEIQAGLQMKQYELGIKELKVELDSQKNIEKHALEAHKANAELQVKQLSYQLDEMAQTFLMQLEAQRVQLEAQDRAIAQFQAEIQARESMMEEVRLATEMDVRQYEAAASVAAANPPDEPQAPTAPVINVIQPPAVNLRIEKPEPEVIPVPINPLDILG